MDRVAVRPVGSVALVVRVAPSGASACDGELGDLRLPQVSSASPTAATVPTVSVRVRPRLGACRPLLGLPERKSR